MSATMRTVFGMSSSAAHRFDRYGQVEVNFFKTGLPLRIIGRKRKLWPKHASTNGRMVDVRWEREDMRITLAVPRTARQPCTLERARLRELRRHQRKARNRHTCFASNVGRRYPAPGFSRIIERAATAADDQTCTCSGTRATTSSPTMATTRVRSRRISGIAIFRIRRAIPRWRRSGSRSFFEIEIAMLLEFVTTSTRYNNCCIV